MIQEGEYKGFPLLILGDNKTRFQFGKTKARILLAEMQALGPDQFVKMLADFISRHGAKSATTFGGGDVRRLDDQPPKPSADAPGEEA